MNPIVISPYADVLTCNTAPWREDDRLGFMQGIHAICRGLIDIKVTSISYSALVCSACNLRVVVPVSVHTYAELRSHFVVLQPQEWELAIETGAEIVCRREFGRGPGFTHVHTIKPGTVAVVERTTDHDVGIVYTNHVGMAKRYFLRPGEFGEPYGAFMRLDPQGAPV